MYGHRVVECAVKVTCDSICYSGLMNINDLYHLCQNACDWFGTTRNYVNSDERT